MPSRAYGQLLATGLLVFTLPGCDADSGVASPNGPAAVLVESGNGQRGRVGAVLPASLSVRVVDQAGRGIGNAEVSFRPTAGSGRVEFARVATTTDGRASAGVWTLGETLGTQRVEAVVDALAPAVFAAVATGVPAALRIVSGDGQAGVAGEPAGVRPIVRVLGADGMPLAGIAVAFIAQAGSVEGAQVTTSSGGEASPESWTLGPLAGTQELLAAVPGAGVAGNPAVIRALVRPGPPAAMTVAQGDRQEVEAGSAALVAPAVRVADAHGNGVPGVGVRFVVSRGGGRVTGAAQATDDLGRATVDSWIVGEALGPEHALEAIAVSGGADFAGTRVSFSATGVPPSFDIRLVHTDSSQLTAGLDGLFEQAAARWEAVVSGNLAPYRVQRASLLRCTKVVEHPPALTIDDLLVFATVSRIDGPGGAIATAGPCVVRDVGGLPVVGTMSVDAADVAGLRESGHLAGTLLHEMGHVLGLGTLWRHHGLLRDPAESASSRFDTHFAGATAAIQFDAAGGRSYAGAKVPVENLYGTGTRNVHWRESVFGDELMTGLVDVGRLNPFSAVTIASMEDMGYAGVSYDEADEYALPSARAGAAVARKRISLAGDVRQGPIVVVDVRGRVVRHLRFPGS